uniref:Uncharacterized protein n=1 Tax=Brassica oleracea TaxID=3712 RepID=A0A3P6BEK4_BRAOL|nr:unnamed protein product [Brassica oleracea]
MSATLKISQKVRKIYQHISPSLSMGYYNSLRLLLTVILLKSKLVQSVGLILY